MEKMHFTRMDQGTDEDFRILKQVHEHTLNELPDRLFGLLRDLSKDTAYNITRYDHCLQSATRALRDGTIDTANPALLDHLRRTALADADIANPRHVERKGDPT